MRLTFLIAVLSLVLAQSVYGANSSAKLTLHGDCCETLCQEMPGCGAMFVCQACASPATNLHQRPVLKFDHGFSFARPNHDLESMSPVHAIWTPPD